MKKVLKTLNASNKLSTRKTRDFVIKCLKEYLKNRLIRLYGSSQKSDYAQLLAEINKDGQSAVCAKQLTAGDVAWRCLDCEKDPTCIICKECFEKSDHEGHRVQLKRNISGCCDCGDPEAWDENHFCSDHKGYNIEPEELLKKLPAKIRQGAEEVFDDVAKELKRYCMRLQNSGEQCQVDGMTRDVFTRTMVECIRHLTKFMFARIEECPSFIHILGKSLNRIFLDPEKFVKNQDHKTCCVRVFPPNSEEEIREYEDVFRKHPQAEGLCSCTPLDLCMQTNSLLDNEGRESCYQLLFKLFQSYRFKQYLTLSLTANYSYIICQSEESENEIAAVGVQVFTSDEMSILVFKNPDLRNNILNQLEKSIKEYRATPSNESFYYQMFKVLHDIKYIARPDSLKYCIGHTDFLERFISVLGHFYFVDTKERRTTMVDYLSEGGVSDRLLNIESYLIKVAIQYFKEIPLVNHSKTRSLLLAFAKCFEEINKTMESKKLTANGFYNLPAHRLFAYYLTRLLVFGWIDKGKKGTRPTGISISEGFRSILKESLQGSTKSNVNMIEESKMEEKENDEEDVPLLFSSLDEQQLQSSLISYSAHGTGNTDKQIEQLLKSAMLPIILSSSFVHEIEARKWVYHGIHLEDFPNFYYRELADEYFLQDIALCQILLCCEDENRRINPYGSHETIIDYMIDHVGLDKQLQTFFKGIISRKLVLKDLTKLQSNFDPDKLRMHLTIFLRYLIYLCQCEISFLKQVFNRKDIKAEKLHQITNENTQEAKSLWKEALKKEAVHLLMLNKVNTPIAELKECMMSSLVKDEVFQDLLFEVSDQGRDINNQVTFRLKPEYYPWFDPFQYGVPEQHSQIYQMYDTNQYKDKCLDEGLNDIVGDYMGNYKQASSLNQQIMDAMATSKLPQIICPILIIWLKYRKKVAQDGSEATQVQKQEQRSTFQMGMASKIQRLQAQSQSTTRQGLNMSLINQLFQNQLQNLDNKFIDKFTEDEKNNKVEYNEDLLAKLIDNTLGHYSLKLFKIFINSYTRFMEKGQYSSSQILSCPSKINETDKRNFISQLIKKEFELVNLLLEYRGDLQIADEEKKTFKFISYLLEKIYLLDKSVFKFVGQALGLIVGDDQLMDDRGQSKIGDEKIIGKKKDDQPIVDSKKKKDKMKKMQQKMMKKMKNNAGKFLEARHENVDNQDKDQITSPQVQEDFQCAFCQEQLIKENFKQSPFGNFAFVQTSKLLHHSIEQTIKGQRRALKNADLSYQFTNQKEAIGSSLVDTVPENNVDSETCQELKFDEMSDKDGDIIMSDDQIDSSSKGFKLKKSYISKIVCNTDKGSFMNEYTGAGAVVTNCKHYAHLSCLRKYYLEQTSADGQHHQQLTGFNPEEFSCPICKSIQNSLIPVYSLRDFEDDMSVESKRGKLVSTQDQDVPLMEFYVDYISQIVKKQQGFLSKEELAQQENRQKNILDFLSKEDLGEKMYQQKMRTILLVDIKSDPKNVIKHLSNYFVHRISLIDIKSLKDFDQSNVGDHLSNLHSSLGSLLRLALKVPGSTFEKQPLQILLNTMSDEIVYGVFNSQPKSNAFYSSNLLVKCVELLFLCSLKFQDLKEFSKEQYESAIDYIVRQFYFAFRIQFVLSSLFRKNNGTLKGDAKEIKKILSTDEIVALDQAIGQANDLSDINTQIQLPVLRKLFAAVYTLKKKDIRQGPGTVLHSQDQNMDILKEVHRQTDDQKEVEMLMSYLNLTDRVDKFLDFMTEQRTEDHQTKTDKYLDYLAATLGPLTNSQFLQEMLGQFANRMIMNADQQQSIHHEDNSQQIIKPISDTQLRVEMPINLILMTPYFEFNLFEMPENFKNLQTQYYKKKCQFCDRVVIENATCLLNGQTMCWFQMRRAQNMEQCRINKPGQQEPAEGLLSWHSRVQEGGITILMRTSSGSIILLNNGVSAIYATPYRNRFGEQASDIHKNYDDFVIDSQGGGIDYLAKLKKSYMNFTIANDIVQQRTNPDSKFKVYVKNVL